MTEVIPIAAIFAAILFFGLWRVERARADRAQGNAALLTVQLDQQSQQLQSLTTIVQDLDGGVEARIAEHTRLSLALQKDHTLTRERPELVVYLNRNNSLYYALQRSLPGR